MGRVQQGYKGNRSFILSNLRYVHSGKGGNAAPLLLMYRRNLEGARSNARVSLPNDKEARHFRSHRTQPASVSSAVDVGIRGSRAAHQEEPDPGFTDFALLSFERGRRFVPDRPTSCLFLRAYSVFRSPESAVALRFRRSINISFRVSAPAAMPARGHDGTAIEEPLGTLPSSKPGLAPSVIFSACEGRCMIAVYASFSSVANQEALAPGEGPQ